MENYIFKISVDTVEIDKTVDLNAIQKINADLRVKLLHLKNSIDNDPFWDEAKRNTNEYEYIFSTSKKHTKICRKNPISRAYFKLWEILCDFDDELFPKFFHHINTGHIAEGPGGFIECLLDYRKKRNINIKNIYGITLLTRSSLDNKIPFWKLNMDICIDNNIYLNRKNDNSGDLYQISNIDKFVQKVGRNTCQLVTADGGFDFSNDFGKQEESFLRLFLSEIYTASLIQQYDGNLIIKVFDLFTEQTNILFSILYKLYSKLYITKPFTSRPANSEKYLVCIGFKKNNSIILTDLRKELMNFDNLNTLQKYYDEKIASRLCVFNTYYTNRQITYLEKTLQESGHIKYIEEVAETEKIKSQQSFHKCIDWCDFYGIPY
jgi:23S rRNA U2552 (ribose-2'-O)-methylase RlmE/FtsJ